jgi:hypothetical protein
MVHVGLDLHSKRIAICVLRETGQVCHRCQVHGLEEMLRILRGLPDRFEVCYDASCRHGHHHHLLQPLAARVLVAHPGQLRRPGVAEGCPLPRPLAGVFLGFLVASFGQQR